MRSSKQLAAAGLALWLGLSVPCVQSQTNQAKIRKHTTMITDRLENAHKYYALHPSFAKAFAILQNPDLAKLEHGKHVIDGDKIYASIGINKGRQKNEALLEAHRKYIDIQYVIEGYDEMGWSNVDDCRMIATPYKPDGDIEFFADKPALYKKVQAGQFAIFFPEDAHAPVISDGDILKVVIKVAVD